MTMDPQESTQDFYHEEEEVNESPKYSDRMPEA